MRSLTPVELASVVAVAGSVLAVAGPVFVKNLHASRLAEPLDGLRHIGARATALAAMRPARAAYPPPAPLTPAEVPRGEAATDPKGTWDHRTWRMLEFGFQVPHAYSFVFESHNEAGRASFVARAHGDLDGDGVLSQFEISGESVEGAEPRVFRLESNREIE